MSVLTAKADFPEKLEFLFKPARYKIAYGGRGGAKTWGFARALLILGAEKPLRILCVREIQKSISESVHQTLKDQVEALGLSGFYDVLQTEIRGKNGTLILFAGLKHNINNIKSKEGIDIVWAEEADAITKGSWDTLIPTIRKEGSEIWVSFNPSLDDDETYKRFVRNPPANAVVVKVGWQDNPWFPAVLDEERRALKDKDPDAYLHVWEGQTIQVLDGAIYANELRAAAAEDRIRRVPYDAGKPVHTFWDLGRADSTAIWFAQQVGFEFRLIDYYENRGFALSHYLTEVQGRRYVWGEDWLPHDAQNELLASERTIEQQLRAAGRNVRIVPKIGIADGINAGRTIFGRCFFDEEKCADGLNALRHYQYEPIDKDASVVSYKKNPLHNWASHGSDAFRYFAVAMEEAHGLSPDRRARYSRKSSGGGSAWAA